MSVGFDYVLLDQQRPRTALSFNPIKATLGLVTLLFLGAAGWTSRQANRVLFHSTSPHGAEVLSSASQPKGQPKLSASDYKPEGGRLKYVAKAGPPGVLQSAGAPASGQESTCVFFYGPTFQAMEKDAAIMEGAYAKKDAVYVFGAVLGEADEEPVAKQGSKEGKAAAAAKKKPVPTEEAEEEEEEEDEEIRTSSPRTEKTSRTHATKESQPRRVEHTSTQARRADPATSKPLASAPWAAPMDDTPSTQRQTPHPHYRAPDSPTHTTENPAKRFEEDLYPIIKPDKPYNPSGFSKRFLGRGGRWDADIDSRRRLLVSHNQELVLVQITKKSPRRPLSLIDKKMGYNTKKPNAAAVRRSMVFAIHKNNSVSEAHWYFQGAASSFRCSVCSKSFASSSALARHMPVHEGTRRRT
eukprot:g23017.t1